jgi:hypothetical protein
MSGEYRNGEVLLASKQAELVSGKYQAKINQRSILRSAVIKSLRAAQKQQEFNRNRPGHTLPKVWEQNGTEP